MECIIPGANIRVISRTIQALAKLSDELHIEAESNTLSLLSTNTTKTAYAKYTFQYTFFTSLNISNITDSQEKISCKVCTKTILKIFKFKPQKEKKIELCKIDLVKDASCILFKFRYNHEINVIHEVNIIDFQSILISYKDTNMMNTVSGPGYLFTKILSDLHPNDAEINVQYSTNNAIIRNYDTGSRNVKKSVRSQMTLASKEFMTYNIMEETSLTFSLKPFRSAIQFADIFNLNITWKIESGGRPIIITMRSSTFEITYVVSTANTDGITQSTNSSLIPSIEENCALREMNDIVCKENCDKPRASFSNILNNLIQDNKKKDIIRAEDTSNLCSNNVDDYSLCETPHSKRIKMIFSKYFNDGFSETTYFKNNGVVLAPSDTDSD